MLPLELMVDNGRLLYDVRPRWRELFLDAPSTGPNSSATVAPRAVFTDGSEQPLDAEALYESLDPAVATVDATRERLRARADRRRYRRPQAQRDARQRHEPLGA